MDKEEIRLVAVVTIVVNGTALSLTMDELRRLKAEIEKVLPPAINPVVVPYYPSPWYPACPSYPWWEVQPWTVTYTTTAGGAVMDKITYTSEHLPYPDGFYVSCDLGPNSYPESFYVPHDPGPSSIDVTKGEDGTVTIKYHYETETTPTPWQDWCLAERRSILEQATARMLPCPAEYAEQDMFAKWENMDERDLFDDIEGELLDIINYSAAQIIKLRVMREQVEK